MPSLRIRFRSDTLGGLDYVGPGQSSSCKREVCHCSLPCCIRKSTSHLLIGLPNNFQVSPVYSGVPYGYRIYCSADAPAFARLKLPIRLHARSSRQLMTARQRPDCYILLSPKRSHNRPPRLPLRSHNSRTMASVLELRICTTSTAYNTKRGRAI